MKNDIVDFIPEKIFLHPLWLRLIFYFFVPLALTGFIIIYYLNGAGSRDATIIYIDDQKHTQLPVLVSRNAHDIPSISGATDNAVFFGLGYAQAKDRIFQMDIQRRLAQGRLSEVFGEDTLNSDIYMRTLGLDQLAKRDWEGLSDEAKESLIAFAAGVNAYIAEKNFTPIEFKIYSYSPGQWGPIDSLSILKLFSLNLTSSYFREIERELASRILPVRHFRGLFPNVDIAHSDSSIDLSKMAAIERHFREANFTGGHNIGSNAWVISGHLTKSGSNILANDPHLALQIPSPWYPAVLRGSSISSKGMALVGLPLIILGANSNVAWGATNLLADMQDLIFEQVNPQKPNLYYHDGQWKEFSQRVETIYIAPNYRLVSRPVKSINLKVRSTINGPVLSDIDPGQKHTLSLRWVPYLVADTTYESFFKLNYAHDWSSFLKAVELFVCPSLNILFGDKNNNIGQAAAGRIPIRNQGNGMIPTQDFKGWKGFIPWVEMPRDYNPPSGFIVSANNKIGPENYKHFITNDWADPSRYERISQLITQGVREDLLDSKYISKMQADLFDIKSPAMMKKLIVASVGSDELKPYLSDMNHWNGDMGSDTYVPALYSAWIRNLQEMIFKDEFEYYYNASSQRLSSIVEDIVSQVNNDTLIRALEYDQFWCDNINSFEVEACSQMVVKSFLLAIKELSKVAGSDFSEWRWRDINQKYYRSILSDENRVTENLFSRKFSGGGNLNTIDAAAYKFDSSKGYVQIYGASFRQVIELSEKEKIFLVNSTGQSEVIWGGHYDDMSFLMQNNNVSLVGD